jgi:hypothetical protein
MVVFVGGRGRAANGVRHARRRSVPENTAKHLRGMSGRRKGGMQGNSHHLERL